ncbi:hypothetical protein SDC9_129081 [bioreactor metagenome]|uniref:Uncharacterized protein n=1 Tax=bioreactor metagenome TaxID=1076179 RepID=A0A645CYS8_9ZZZZ
MPASLWAASMMKPRSAATARPMWARCRAVLSPLSARPEAATLCCCWTRWISWATTSGATPRQHCLKSWTASRTAPSGIIFSKFPLTFPTCFSSPPQIRPRPFRGLFWTVWRSLSLPVIQTRKSCRSPNGFYSQRK